MKTLTNILMAVVLLLAGVTARAQSTPLKTTTETRALLANGGIDTTTAALVLDLKQNNLFTNLLYLKLYGRPFQDATNSISIRGPKQGVPGVIVENSVRYGLARTNIAGSTTAPIYIYPGPSSCTLVTAQVSAGVSDSGSFAELMTLSSGPWVPANYVTVYKNPGGFTIGSSYGGAGPATSFSPINNNPNIYDNDLGHTWMLALNATANTVQFSVDGIPETEVAYVHTDPANMTNLWFGSVFGVESQVRATVNVQMLYGRALGSNEMTALNQIIRRNVFPDVVEVWEGDSLITTSVANGYGNGTFHQELRGRGSDWSIGRSYEIAAGGDTISNIVRVELPSQLALYQPTGNVQRAILTLWAGVNDINNFSAVQNPNSTVRGWLRQAWSLARGLGFEVVGMTITRTATGGSAARNADALLINDMIREDFANGYFDYLVDIEAAFTAADPGYYTNTAYLGDGVHPNTVAARAIIIREFQTVGRVIFP